MKHNEDKLQAEIIKAVRLLHNDVFIYAIPNGGYRNMIEAARLKKQGVTAGVSDLHLIFNNQIIFIEVKTKTGVMSEYQKQFKVIVESNGFKHYIVRDVETVLQIIIEHKLK